MARDCGLHRPPFDAARLPGISRETIDRAAMDGVDVIEVPGAHAKPAILVPRDEMALAWRLQQHHRGE